MESKKWYRSKTLWVNVATALAIGQLIIGFFGYSPDQDYLNQASETLVMLNPFLNLILRFYTKKPVSL